MGYYGTICSNCGGPAIFFSWGPSIECSTCRRRYEFVSLLAARRAQCVEHKARAFDEIVEAGCTSDSKMTFVDEVDDIVETTRIALGELPDPTKETP